MSLLASEWRQLLPARFFFNDTATTEIYTLSLHDALPISSPSATRWWSPATQWPDFRRRTRSEEHTSELQSLRHLVCRLLLEKTTFPLTPSLHTSRPRLWYRFYYAPSPH